MTEKFTISGGQAQPAPPKSDLSLAIVAAEFNKTISSSLVEGAQQVFAAQGISDVSTLWVPGAFEIPITCERLLNSKKLDGIVTLGAVIRGDTPHFDYVAGECAKGVNSVSLKYKTPIMFGVLTTNTVEQALNRAGLKLGNKGAEAAAALLDLLALFREHQI